MKDLNLDFKKTALVIIDLQEGIVKMSNGYEVVKKAKLLVDLFRENNSFISFVNVDFLDGTDRLMPIIDEGKVMNIQPKGWSKLVKELEVREDDYRVTKRQWGAFFGTDLDIELRRRGVDTIVLCGISTNIGVESTAREAYSYGYNQIFVTDAMTAASKEEHECTIKYIFPRIGRIRTTDEFISEVKGE
ncbi:isochorismatase family protein [Clostridium sardiniense]|uniref:isochorismatase family protein n=1 Tax=Clostridium sardiniense TaxID=29369 RepID=UPI003D33DBDF